MLGTSGMVKQETVSGRSVSNCHCKLHVSTPYLTAFSTEVQKTRPSFISFVSALRTAPARPCNCLSTKAGALVLPCSAYSPAQTTHSAVLKPMQGGCLCNVPVFLFESPGMNHRAPRSQTSRRLLVSQSSAQDRLVRCGKPVYAPALTMLPKASKAVTRALRCGGGLGDE